MKQAPLTRLAALGGEPALSGDWPVPWPVISKADQEAVLRPLERGVLSGPFAPEVSELESQFAQFIGTSHCLATSSGTSALQLGLVALNIQPGDEVILPAYTFVASALAILQQNAIPVFVDIERESFGMDPEKLAQAITPRTRAILPVHIHGTPCRLDPILDIARKHQIPVLEDSCQAHGATYKNQKVGSFGDLAAFSLQSSKALACGEGGLLVSNHAELIERANQARNFGENIHLEDRRNYLVERPLDMERDYHSFVMGGMHRLNELSAALALSQLERLDSWISKAQENAEFLSARLTQLPGISPPSIPSDRTSIFHKYRVFFDARELGLNAEPIQVRAALLKGLRAEGVEACLWQTRPVPGQTLFSKKVGLGKDLPWRLQSNANISYDLAQYPNTNWLLENSICLFSQTFPIACQSKKLCEAYANTFAKVWLQVDQLL